MKSVGKSLLFLICFMIQFFGQGFAVYGYSFDQNYDKLQLSELLINADQILICVPKIATIRENDDQILFKLQDISSIIENDVSITNQIGHIFVASSKKASRNTPVIVPRKKHLLFLKEFSIDDAFRVKFGLDKSAKVFEVYPDWQAAICLDFSIVSLARNLLKSKYGIDDPAEFIDIVENLTHWRVEGKNDEEKIAGLLSLLNSQGNNALYEDNIPAILLRLGVKVERQGNEFVIREDWRKQPSGATR